MVITRDMLPLEVRDYMDGADFQRIFCKGCVLDEGECPCGYIPGDFWCRRWEQWRDIAETLTDMLEMAGSSEKMRSDVMDEADSVVWGVVV